MFGFFLFSWRRREEKGENLRLKEHTVRKVVGKNSDGGNKNVWKEEDVEKKEEGEERKIFV